MTAIAERLPDGYDCRREDLPELNVGLLFDLVKWAEGDEALAQRYRNWGTWKQGLWAEIDWNELAVHGIDPEDGGEVEIARRNGVCGSAYCMAGQAVAQSDYRIIMEDGGASNCIKEEWTGEVNEKGWQVWQDVPGARREAISDVAATVLGLTYVEQSQFFNGDNELPRLRELANLFTDARRMPLLFPDEPIASLYVEDADDDY